MSIRVTNFLGTFGWEFKKKFPRVASESYLKMQFVTRRKTQSRFIEYFMNEEVVPHPQIVNMETINRCNNTCEFCTANRNCEKRPFAKMPTELFHSIIDQLRDWNYKGHITMYGNNEPWLDNRIVEFHKYAREQLPDCFIFMSTNGLLLNIDRLKQIKPYINQLIINNYCLDMKLFDNIKEIYDYVKANPEEFKDVEIIIQMRYIKDVLSNRAGSAPNKKATSKIVKETCLMPYTDMWIMPNGKLGVCCCDNFEVTDLADLSKISLKEAWNTEKYKKLRMAIKDGRHNYNFCKYCDFIDAGLRMRLVNSVIKSVKSNH